MKPQLGALYLACGEIIPPGCQDANIIKLLKERIAEVYPGKEIEFLTEAEWIGDF
jgi:hypothetical protein